VTDGDLVYDIGAGSGAISAALLKKGARVVAFEKDREVYLMCQKELAGQERFELYLDDFLLREFPPHEKYKVFSNIPFFHTADIINRILFNENPPEDCYLIVQKEAAEKYAGIPKDTLASLLIKPVFWVDIVYHFRRNDFHPVPSVDISLLQIERRRCRLFPARYYSLYEDFVVFLREGANRTTKKSLKQLFTFAQIKQLSRLFGIDYRSSPAELSFHQYLGIFQFYLDCNLRDMALIRGIQQRLRKQQADGVKIHRTSKRRRSR
jgi:23S rRNA (adenine-N6)-dimethyltransferase